MITCMRSLGAVLLSLWTSTAVAQSAQPIRAGHNHPEHHHDSAAPIAAFIADARAATARYHDRNQAIADGFRLLGPDFPAMGEHWVNAGRMVDGTLDVARPQALSYATIGGKPTLIGVIYARPLHGDESAPDFPVAGHPWHDHVGAIDEESVLLHHTPSGERSAPGVRLAMLHAWVWAENPDGVFAADNWALPFVRLSLEVPVEIPTSAARALSLVSGGDAYYRMLFGALVRPGPRQEAFAHRRIGAAGVRDG